MVCVLTYQNDVCTVDQENNFETVFKTHNLYYNEIEPILQQLQIYTSTHIRDRCMSYEYNLYRLIMYLGDLLFSREMKSFWSVMT